MILETERLVLRKMTQADYPALCRILQDEKTMYAYEGAFSDEEVQQWLDRQLARYAQYGFGLWLVVLKETGKAIGQCGVTMQPWDGREVLEVGYLFERAHWHHGYATEAARGGQNRKIRGQLGVYFFVYGSAAFMDGDQRPAGGARV